MAEYLVKFFDKKGNVKKSYKDNYPSEVGRWSQNVKLDKKDGYKSSFKSVQTKTGLNRKVVSYRACRQDGTLACTASLIRNSNRKYRKGYK